MGWIIFLLLSHFVNVPLRRSWWNIWHKGHLVVLFSFGRDCLQTPLIFLLRLTREQLLMCMASDTHYHTLTKYYISKNDQYKNWHWMTKFIFTIKYFFTNLEALHFSKYWSISDITWGSQLSSSIQDSFLIFHLGKVKSKMFEKQSAILNVCFIDYTLWLFVISLFYLVLNMSL